MLVLVAVWVLHWFEVWLKALLEWIDIGCVGEMTFLSTTVRVIRVIRSPMFILGMDIAFDIADIVASLKLAVVLFVMMRFAAGCHGGLA